MCAIFGPLPWPEMGLGGPVYCRLPPSLKIYIHICWETQNQDGASKTPEKNHYARVRRIEIIWYGELCWTRQQKSSKVPTQTPTPKCAQKNRPPRQLAGKYKTRCDQTKNGCFYLASLCNPLNRHTTETFSEKRWLWVRKVTQKVSFYSFCCFVKNKKTKRLFDENKPPEALLPPSEEC